MWDVLKKVFRNATIPDSEVKITKPILTITPDEVGKFEILLMWQDPATPILGGYDGYRHFQCRLFPTGRWRIDQYGDEHILLIEAERGDPITHSLDSSGVQWYKDKDIWLDKNPIYREGDIQNCECDKKGKNVQSKYY